MSGRGKISYLEMPGRLLSIAIVLGVIATALFFALAIHQPRFTETLAVENGTAVLQDKAGKTIGFAKKVGAAHIAAEIDPLDLTPEPDVLESYDEQQLFWARQDGLARALAASGQHAVSITFANPSNKAVKLTPSKILPFEFWLQIIVGFAGLVISAWIWAIRPRSLSNQLFGLVGLCLWLAACSAAIYSTRWLALPSGLFKTLSVLNGFGSIGFGIALICLFLIYPTRLVSNRALAAVALPLLGWFAFAQFNVLGTPANETPLQIATEMLLILILVIIQFVKSRGRPLEMAAIRWVGVSTLIGSGLFICTAIIPILLGSEPLVNQSYAFAFFLIVHLGIAFGLQRQSLFASEIWAIAMFKAVSVGLMLIAVDVALVALLGSLNGAAVLTMLLILPFFYLPWRSLVQRWLFQTTSFEDLLEEVAHIALIGDISARTQKWRVLLDKAFTPLKIEEQLGKRDDTLGVMIMGQGIILQLPSVIGCPPVQVQYKNKGTRLFQERDRQIAARMIEFATSLKRQQEAFQQGVTSERSRISRDLHDDLSAKLMFGLSLENPDELKSVLRSSLAEVRTIVTADVGDNRPLADILGDSRAEAADRLEAVGITLDWPLADVSGYLKPQPQKALSSVIREIITNIIKHSAATQVDIQMRLDNGRIYIVASDNGTGPSIGSKHGNGLKNIRVRLSALDGYFEYGALESGGFRSSISLPVDE